MRYNTHSEKESMDIAAIVATTLPPGSVVCLHGELGSGKTTFVKGLAKALGVTETVKSPTFTLMNVYRVNSANHAIKRLIHIDTYRLADEKELSSLGTTDFLGEPDTITAIEWPEKSTALLTGLNVKNIYFSHESATERSIVVE